MGAERIFFYDDNFVVKKARTAQLLEAMVTAGLTPPWFAQVRADVVLSSVGRPELDHRFLDLMRRAGAQIVMIGFEAITDEGLASLGKRLSVATEERAVAALHKHGIAVHGMFVAGLDTDDASSAVATARFARRLGIDTFQLMAETPLPGTRLWQRARAEGRLLSEDWSLFDGHQVVMRPTLMSALDLQLGILEATRRFYSWPGIIRSGVAGAFSHLPTLVGTTGPAVLRQLPALAKMAVARRWDEVTPYLEKKLPSPSFSGLAQAFWLPATRMYARRQLSAWWAAGRSPRPPGAPAFVGPGAVCGPLTWLPHLVWPRFYFTVSPAYLGSNRVGLRSASRRKGSPSSWLTMTSKTVGRPEAVAARRASPTSPGSGTVVPSAPMARAIPAKLGFFRSVPGKRLS